MVGCGPAITRMAGQLAGRPLDRRRRKASSRRRSFSADRYVELSRVLAPGLASSIWRASVRASSTSAVSVGLGGRLQRGS